MRAVIKSEKKRIIYAPVYTPFRVDTDGEAMAPAEVEKMAHDFLSKGRFDCIDTQHDEIKNGCLVVESFVARKGDPDFVPGEWVLGVKIVSDAIWSKVQKGELNGFSFGSDNIPTRMGFIVDLLQPIAGIGTTEKAGGPLPEHDHEVIIEFTDDARIIPTETAEILGHTHPILRGTATEIVMDHAHGIAMELPSVG